MSIESISYMGFPNCLKLSNGTVDVVAATEVGPRILFYGAPGGRNILGEHLGNSVDTALGQWKPYGGHRLWVWPELFPATYAPDNDPIDTVAEGEYCLSLRQPVDGSAMAKAIRIELSESGSVVKLTHTITSHNLWPVEIAPWAITVVAGGTAIVPRVPFQTHDANAAAAQPLSVCAYTDLQDPRFVLNSRYILLTADATRLSSQKFGLRNKQQWCAHLVGDDLLVKRFAHEERANYPDYGANNEVYVEGSYMEVEVLGPIEVLVPGESLSLSEEWSLFHDVGLNGSIHPDNLALVIDPLIQTLMDNHLRGG